MHHAQTIKKPTVAAMKIMDLETLLEFLPYVIPLATAVVGWVLGYYLGLRSQKIQTRQKYVTDTVKEQYPSLFAEMRRNSEYIDHFLEKPIVTFQFLVLTEFLKKRLGALMKKHHADLFQTVNNFAEKIQPKFEELNTLRFNIHNELYKIWHTYIHETLLGAYPEWVSERIGDDLIKTVNQYNVLSELLSKKHNSMARKVEKSIVERTAEIKEQEMEKRHKIRGIPVGDTDFDKVTESLVELAKPKIESILKVYAFLKEQNDTEIKGKIIPLLNKYIGNPV